MVLERRIIATLIVATIAIEARPQPAWPQSAGEAPGPTSNHKMAYDPAGKRVLVYSGIQSAGSNGNQSRLWSWNGTAWSLVATDGPPGRDDPQVAFDTRRNRLVLYGGRQFGTSRDDQTLLTDTWEWDGKSWLLVDSIGVGRRVHGGMGFDPTRGVTVLFGGFGEAEGSILNDTWEWDGRVWTRRSDGPPRRWVNALVPTSRGILLHSAVIDGYDQTTSLARGELWRWDGSLWAKVDSAPALSPQSPTTPIDDGILFYSGWVPNAPARTWRWGAGGWREVAGEQPTRRRNNAMAYDADRKRVVMFGGETDRERFADLWEFDGRAWHLHRP